MPLSVLMPAPVSTTAERAEASQWATRPLAGTLAYIAPEMVTSALAAGPRSDIYSLGVTLYEMITGRRPWDSDDPGELAMLHRQAKPIDIRALRPDVPDPVAEIVHSMLAKDPLRRPSSAREQHQQLAVVHPMEMLDWSYRGVKPKW